MAEKNLSIGQAKMVFRNFQGKEGTFNEKGNRNFSVLLSDEQAEKLSADGWNVKWLKPRSEEDAPQARLPVAVSYKYYPPTIWLITSGGKTALSQQDVSVLDYAEIVNADLVINGSRWEMGGKSGIKAYLKTAYVTIEEDEFAKKYRDVPDSAISSVSRDDSETPFD